MTASRQPVHGEPRGLKTVLRRVRDRLRPVTITAGDEPGVRILQGIKLFRDVRVGGTTYRGSSDSESRPVDYLFDGLPDGALRGKTVLDLGSAGGAVCFAAVERGCELAVGLETAESRIRGAEAIRRITGLANVRFIPADFYTYLGAAGPRFDAVFALNVLHHLGNPFPLLRRMCRAAKHYVILETPEDVGPSRYGEYSPDALQVEGARPARSPEDYARFLKLNNFVIERAQQSEPGVRFHRSDEAQRSVFVFRRDTRLKSRAERLAELEVYRQSRSESYNRARLDPFNVDVRPGERFADVLTTALGDEWTAGDTNYLFAGPRASGKTYCYEQMPVTCRPSYDPKVFKFPDAGGKRGLRRHLNPRPGHGRQFAQVLLGTRDDDEAHCTGDELVSAIATRRVACVLLNVGFDEHVDRLYRREADRVGVSSIDYDVSLRFDCSRYAEACRAAGVRYRVLTMVGGPEPAPGFGSNPGSTP